MSARHCCLCGETIATVYEQNNPAPLVGDGSGVCCRWCDEHAVLPVRILGLSATEEQMDAVIKDFEKVFAEARARKTVILDDCGACGGE